MYRKKQQELQKMEENQQVLTRVSNYPLVRDTWGKVSEVYQRGKDGSRILRFCGNVAESSASLAYKASMPVIEKLPVGVVNDYAVNKLETLEQQYPIIVKPTEELVSDLKSYSTSKLGELTTYGTDQFDRLAEVARLNSVLNVADAIVDKFLPPTSETQQPDENTKTGEVATAEIPAPKASVKVRMLSDKLKRRAYDNAMSKVKTIEKRSQESVGKLLYTVDLIAYAQDSIRNMNLQDTQEKLQAVYEEVTREGGEQEPLPANATLERKTIYAARALTLRARQTFKTISHLSFTLPESTRSAVNDAYKYTENLYETFMKTTSFKDFGNQLLSHLRERLHFLESVANNLTSYMMEATPIRWLASSWTSKPDCAPPINSLNPPSEDSTSTKGDYESDDDDNETEKSTAETDSLLNSTLDDTLDSTARNSDFE